MEENKIPLAPNKKMELTNKYNLPEIICKAVSNDLYMGFGDISVTTLIDSPRVRMLKKMHKPNNDVSDFIWSSLGTSFHNLMEFAEYDQYEVKILKQAQDVLNRHGAEKVSDWMEKFIDSEFDKSINNDIIQEKRLSIEVNGWVLSGKFDRYNLKKKLLSDFKLTSTFSYEKKEHHDKYIQQLSIYAYMLREHGFEVEEAEIIFMFRDWSEAKTAFNKDYPPTQALAMPIKLMSHEETKEFIEKRIRLHQEVEESMVLPECSPKETWATTDEYKIYKKVKGKLNKKCINGGIHSSYESAMAHKSKIEPTTLDELVVKHIPSERKRCLKYCPVKEHCDQFKKYLETINK